MGDSKNITVQTENGSVVARKLALGDYAALLRALKKLPANFGKYLEGNDASDLKDNAKLFADLPEIIADAIPEFCEVLAIATDQDAAFFEVGDLADALDVLAAVLELNDYNRIAAAIKKMTAGKQTSPVAPGPATPEATAKA